MFCTEIIPLNCVAFTFITPFFVLNPQSSGYCALNSSEEVRKSSRDIGLVSGFKRRCSKSMKLLNVDPEMPYEVSYAIKKSGKCSGDYSWITNRVCV